MSSTVIGAMSGSSLDGLDIALCHFDVKDGIIKWSIEHGETISFPPALQKALQAAPSLNGYELLKLDASFGKHIGETIHHWRTDNNCTADFIASHGHTVFHEPANGFTTQIGSGAHIAFATGIDTITNFRAADVAAGGQGAPFAPIADKALFPGYQAYLNLGGIANVSIHATDGQWKGWDIGPCNQALNHLATKLNLPYDYGGQIAAQGKANKKIIEALVAMFPFENGRPKGLSNKEVQKTWIQYLDTRTESVVDLLASTTEAVVVLILKHLQEIASLQPKILVTGGGAHNLYLIKRIEALSGQNKMKFELPAATIIDYKECALMAYLGYLTLHGRPYGIKDITGASSDTIGGAIHRACR
jgi:anhydro-N-acetylmuramic acid kinase